MVLPTLLAGALFGAAAPNTDGRHDFDFEFGAWRVHHRVKGKDGRWTEFDGTCTTRPAMDGSANIEEHVFDRASGRTRGMAIRAYDAATGDWAIWWIDARNPHAALDPPVKGRFERGVGTFTADGVIDGRTQRTRFLWTVIDAGHARWEQAMSDDQGVTWATNWVMTFERTGDAPAR